MQRCAHFSVFTPTKSCFSEAHFLSCLSVFLISAEPRLLLSLLCSTCSVTALCWAVPMLSAMRFLAGKLRKLLLRFQLFSIDHHSSSRVLRHRSRGPFLSLRGKSVPVFTALCCHVLSLASFWEDSWKSHWEFIVLSTLTSDSRKCPVEVSREPDGAHRHTFYFPGVLW